MTKVASAKAIRCDCTGESESGAFTKRRSATTPSVDGSGTPSRPKVARSSSEYSRAPKANGSGNTCCSAAECCGSPASARWAYAAHTARLSSCSAAAWSTFHCFAASASAAAASAASSALVSSSINAAISPPSVDESRLASVDDDGTRPPPPMLRDPIPSTTAAGSTKPPSSGRFPAERLPAEYVRPALRPCVPAAAVANAGHERARARTRAHCWRSWSTMTPAADDGHEATTSPAAGGQSTPTRPLKRMASWRSVKASKVAAEAKAHGGLCSSRKRR